MNRIIVSDAITLIVLEKQQRLPLLCQLFEQVIIPDAVYKELVVGLQNRTAFSQTRCIHIESVSSSSQLSNLLILLDKGEAEAIELAVTKRLPLIIDEKKGRKIARRLGLIVTGLAGLLILAVRKNVLSPTQARDILDSAVQNGYRLSIVLHKQVLATLSGL